MAEILLFHHALGRTAGFLEFAEALTAAGHTVHTPDLYDGHTFTDLDEGIAFAKQTGFGEVMARGTAAAGELPAELVYGGFSLGLMPAQALTQTRAGARGSLMFHGALPPAEFDAPWPEGVPAQIHVMADDPWGDVDVCRELAAEVDSAELFLYPGSGHLFTDPTSVDHDPESARLVLERTLAFLADVDRPGPLGAPA